MCGINECEAPVCEQVGQDPRYGLLIHLSLPPPLQVLGTALVEKNSGISEDLKGVKKYTFGKKVTLHG